MPAQHSRIFIGTAGWSIPAANAGSFPVDGSHLERYAQVLPGSEINSSFYRPHQSKTYKRWAASVPEEFQFAVKVPKTITHEHRLRDTDALLDRFLGEATTLGSKLGPLLVQLPPSLRFDSVIVHEFFITLRNRFEGDVVCEPRHVSWFTANAEQLLIDYQIARVAADPAPVPQSGEHGGWTGLVYYRLHGSPRIYYSDYSEEYLTEVIAKLRASAKNATTWCIFDNTAGFAATGNALAVWNSIGSSIIGL